MTAAIVSVSRRAAVVSTGLVAVSFAGLALAAPASADVPEGWPEPDPVSAGYALLVLGGIPLLLGLIIALMVYLPALIRGEHVAAGEATVENQWIGGPRKSTHELAGPDTADSQAGGASARW